MLKKETSKVLHSQYNRCPKMEYEDENEAGVPKSKIIASHCVALLTILMFKFTYGLDNGFTTIIIPELYKPDAEIYITRDQLTWFSSNYFMPPVGAIVGGILTQFIGCRMLLFISGILYITAGLIFHWSINATMILSAQGIMGFASGMLKGLCYTYIAEISLPRFRNILLGCVGITVYFGTFSMTTLGTFLHWRTIVLVNVVFPTIGLILVYIVPESPYWLASMNRYDDAARSLAWFRGWTRPECVKTEMHSTLINLDNLSSPESIRTNSTSNIGRVARLKKISKQFYERPFYIPFLTMLFIFIVNNFNGTTSLKIFSLLIFDMIDSPVDPHTGTVILTAIIAIGGIISLILVNIAGKRKILLITLLCSGISFIVVAVCDYLTSTNIVEGPAYHWISMISIIMTEFFNAIGIHKLCFFLNSEIFPLHLRHIGVGIGHFTNTISNSIINKLFLYIIESFTISGSFLFFAVVHFIGFVGIYFIVPETEGKSLKEIEEHYMYTTSVGRINRNRLGMNNLVSGIN